MPVLNYDILHLVMSHCTRPGISTMMKTCRLLNLEGARILLLADWIMLQSEAQIVSFTSFMLGGSDNLDRFDHPLNLHFTIKSLSSEGAANLRDFFFDYGHLLWLRGLIFSHAEQVLAADTNLPSAFANIGCIDYLCLSEAGFLVRAMFQEMWNEVLQARVHFELRDQRLHRFLPDDYQNNPITVLAPLRDVLCGISGTWGATDPAIAIYDGIVFLDVTSLDLYTQDAIHVPHYAHAFPHVMDLCVGTSATIDISYSDDLVFALHNEWRSKNRAAQRTHGSWTWLECFRGSVLNWWSLALECEIKRFEVSDLLGWHFGLFQEMLRMSRPKELVIDLRASTVVLDDFGTLFRRHSVDSLVWLKLEVAFDPLDRDELDASKMVEMLVAACAGATKLQWLHVNIDCYRLRYESLIDNPVIREPEDLPLCSPEVYFGELNVPHLVQRLKSEVTTLRAVLIELHSLRGRESQMVHLGEQFLPETE